MSDRVVILLQRGSQGPPRIVLEHPADVPDADVGVDVTLSPDQKALLGQMKTGPWQPDVVEKIGTFLLDLLKQQPAIKRDFEDRLKETTKDGPIYLRVEPPDLDDWPWEALNDPANGFLALRRAWPIARVRRVPQPKAEYLFVPPLQIVAVLGASGSTPLTRISARDEWTELFGAISKSPLNIRLSVFVAEDDLKQEIDSLALPWVTTGFLDDENALFQDIKNVRPHLLHFFCHGLAASPPFLEIASRANWRRKEDGTIRVDASQLRDRADPEPSSNVWLVTLNCCESAQQAAEGGSRSKAMASSLVMKGFPAVVGMRQRVDSQHASRFCGLWYQTLLDELQTRLESAANKNQSDEFHWGRALFAARQGICTMVDNAPFAQSARRIVEWTIPVLYTRYQPFVIRVGQDLQHQQPLLRDQAGPGAGPPGVAPVPDAPPGAAVVVAPQPASPERAAPGAGRTLNVQEKLNLTGEMQQLVEARASLLNQANIPEAIRANVLRDIDARLSEITRLLA